MSPTGDLLDTKQAAALLGVHELSMVVWRRERRGPKFVRGRDARVVLYRRADIDAWLESSGAPAKRAAAAPQDKARSPRRAVA